MVVLAETHAEPNKAGLVGSSLATYTGASGLATGVASYSNEGVHGMVASMKSERSPLSPTQTKGWSGPSSAVEHELNMLRAKNARLTAEISSGDRAKRRASLKAEQDKEDLEQQVACLRNFAAQALCQEPSLRPLAVSLGVALPDLPDQMGLEAENSRLAAERLRLELELEHYSLCTDGAPQAPVQDVIIGGAATGSPCLVARSVRETELEGENADLALEKAKVSTELARMERDRRRLVLLEAQSRADLDQLQRE